ncbi:hypothetical protein EBR66_01170 [bacterium]|nr:hypothetical protein [bacterium]
MVNFDLAIIGGGPAGCSAAVYAARKQLKTIFITESFDGQSIESPDIQNWIGTPHISGADLAKSLEKHVREYADPYVTLKTGVRAQLVEKIDDSFNITVGTESVIAKAVLITTGGARRKLTVPGAEQFENKGVVYCASCDGPLFAGTDTVVVGAGNAGFETAAQLLAYAKSVTLLSRSADISKADPKTVDAVRAHPNATILTNVVPVEVTGSVFVESVVVEHTKSGERTTIPCSGIFVEIGIIPATDLVKNVVERDQFGRIKISDHRSMRTSHVGIWAAGDCIDGLYHQNNIAAGDAVKALEDIYLWIKAEGN